MGLTFFLKLRFIFSFLFSSHATVFDEIAASHRGLCLSQGIIFYRKLKAFGFRRQGALLLHCCTALHMLTIVLLASLLFLLLLHKLNLVQEIQVLALAVVLMVLVPSSWCRKHRRLLTCASRQLSRLVSASSAFPHKSSVFLLELLLASTVSYLFIADARSSLRSMVPKISLHQYCHR